MEAPQRSPLKDDTQHTHGSRTCPKSATHELLLHAQHTSKTGKSGLEWTHITRTPRDAFWESMLSALYNSGLGRFRSPDSQRRNLPTRGARDPMLPPSSGGLGDEEQKGPVVEAIAASPLQPSFSLWIIRTQILFFTIIQFKIFSYYH